MRTHDPDNASGPTGRPPRRPGAEAGLALLAGLTALALRLVHLRSLTALPTFRWCIMDEAYHDTWARQIASGDWIGHDVFFRAPLYPYFLGLVYALFGAGGLAPRIAQDLIGSAGVVALYCIARRIADRWTALLAALLAACCWPLIYYDNELLITVLEVALSLAAILILMAADTESRRGRALGLLLLGGAAIGLGGIARPNILLFAPAAMIWAAWPRPGGRWRPAAALVIALGAAAPVAPVAARNAIVGHDRVLIASQGGVNFYIGNNPSSDGATAIVPGTRPTWQGGYEDAIALAREGEGRPLRPSEISDYWYRRGLAFWRDQPAAAIRLLARKTFLFFGGVEISNNKDLTFFRSLSPVLSLPLPGAALLMPLGLAGWAAAFRGAGGRRRALMAPLLFAVPYSASIIAFFVTSRYRAPVLPVMALGTALLVREMAQAARRRAWGAIGVLAAASAALAVVLNLNLSGQRDDPGQGHLSLATAWSVGSKLDEAVREYDRAIAAAGPYTAEALRGKGEALAASGRPAEAYDAFERAIGTPPFDPETLASFLALASSTGRYDGARAAALALAGRDPAAAAEIQFAVGSMDQARGRPADAEARYREALRLRPDHLAAGLNLALLLRGAGQLDESYRLLLECARAHPASPQAHLNLAKHYLFTGDRARAIDEAARARRLGASLEPDFQAALDAAGGPR